MRWRIRDLIGIFLCLAHFTGCATRPQAPVPDAGWKSRLGQARYLDEKRSVTGDLFLRVAPLPNTYTLEFSKAGNSLLQLTRQGENGWANGLLARGNYAGPVATAPEYLRPWFVSSAEALSNRKPVPQKNLPTVEIRLQP